MKKNRKENAIEWFAIGAMTLLLYIFVPRNKIREACTIFFFKQFVTWFFGLLVVEKNLISYPSDYFLRKRLNQALHLSFLSTLLYVCCLISIIQKDETNG